MNAYEIRLDVLAAADYLDRDADADNIEHDDADYDALAPDLLVALARDADATFTNVTTVPILDARFSHADVALRFHATPNDLARYVAFYDLDPDDIEPA